MKRTDLRKKCIYTLGKTHQKVAFLVVGPLRFYPPYTNGLVVHATPLVVRSLKTLFLCVSSLSKRSKYGFEKSMVFGNSWHHFVHNPIAWENKISGLLSNFFVVIYQLPGKKMICIRWRKRLQLFGFVMNCNIWSSFKMKIKLSANFINRLQITIFIFKLTLLREAAKKKFIN